MQPRSPLLHDGLRAVARRLVQTSAAVEGEKGPVVVARRRASSRRLERFERLDGLARAPLAPFLACVCHDLSQLPRVSSSHALRRVLTSRGRRVRARTRSRRPSQSELAHPLSPPDRPAALCDSRRRHRARRGSRVEQRCEEGAESPRRCRRGPAAQTCSPCSSLSSLADSLSLPLSQRGGTAFRTSYAQLRSERGPDCTAALSLILLAGARTSSAEPAAHPGRDEALGHGKPF